METNYFKELSISKEIPNLKDIKVCELSLDKKNLFIGGSVNESNRFTGFPMIIANVSEFLITGQMLKLISYILFYLCQKQRVTPSDTIKTENTFQISNITTFDFKSQEHVMVIGDQLTLEIYHYNPNSVLDSTRVEANLQKLNSGKNSNCLIWTSNQNSFSK